MVEGIAQWSAAIIGASMKIPVEFFVNSALEGEIVNVETKDRGKSKDTTEKMLD
jgi:hypothetical protein